MQLNSSTGLISMSTAGCARRILLPLALGLFSFVGAGCVGDQIDATNKLVQQQQDQLERQQQEIEAIKASQNQSYTPGVAASSPGGCDKGVETAASQRGGDRFAAGDFHKALAYYQDALSACSTDDRAVVNVARTYEAMGDKASAIKFYRRAADSNSATVSDAQEEAKSALERLQVSRLP